MSELRLALRVAAGSRGRDAARMTLMALGIALSAMVVALALAVPRIIDHARDAEQARFPVYAERGGGGATAECSRAIVDGQVWGRMVVSGVTATTPLPPGLAAWPQPGHSIVSSELAARTAAHPLDELGVVDAVPIGPDGLVGPHELFSWTVVQPRPGRALLGFGNPHADGLVAPVTPVLWAEILVLVGIPAGLFVVGSLRMGFASRAARFTTLTMIGASPRAMARVFAAEMGAVSLVGVVLGYLAYAIAQPFIGQSGVLGLAWWPAAGALPVGQAALVGVAFVAVVMFASQRVMQGRLGSPASRSSRFRAAMLVAGGVMAGAAAGFACVVWLGALGRLGVPRTSDALLLPLVVALALGSLGLVLVSPLLLAGARALVRPGVLPSVRLGLGQALHHLDATRRQAGAFVGLIAVAGFSSSLVAAWHADALTDPARVSIQVAAADLSAAQRSAVVGLEQPKTIVLISADEAPREVIVGTCADMARTSPELYDDWTLCADTPTVGRGAPPGAPSTVAYVDAAGQQQTVRLTPHANAGFLGDIQLPSGAAPWATGSPSAIYLFVASNQDGSLQRLIADVRRVAPEVHLDYGVKDSRLFAVYTQQSLLLRAGVLGGGTLIVLSFLVGLVEARWAAEDSVRAQFWMGASSGTLRRSFAASLAGALVLLGLPAVALTAVCCWAMLSIWGPDAMAATGVWAMPLLLWAAAVVACLALGWVVGGPGNAARRR